MSLGPIVVSVSGGLSSVGRCMMPSEVSTNLEDY